MTRGAARVSIQVEGFRRSSAELSDCGHYRYRLTRQWAPGVVPTVLWIMLNPSKADADKDDHTIRKCVGFSKRFGAGALEVVNLFAWRATDARELERHRFLDPIGPENDAHLVRVLADPSPYLRRVVAWGDSGGPIARERVTAVAKLIGTRYVECLGHTTNGNPLHPLTLAYARALRPWRPE